MCINVQFQLPKNGKPIDLAKISLFARERQNFHDIFRSLRDLAKPHLTESRRHAMNSQVPNQGAISHFSLSLCRLEFPIDALPVIAARCKTTTTSGWQGGEYTTA